MLVIDKELLDGVTAQAKASPRFTAIPILQKRISFYAVESTCCFTVKMVSWKKAVNLTP